MIYQQVIARRYARALFVSLKKEHYTAVEEQLSGLVDMMSNTSGELARLFEDPAFSPLDRKAVVNRIAQKSEFSEVLHHFLLLLIDKCRIGLLPLINHALVGLMDSEQDRLRVKIMSAYPLAPASVHEISEILKFGRESQVLTESVIDESLLGGIRVEVAGRVFDGSLKAKLAKIKHGLQHLSN